MEDVNPRNILEQCFGILDLLPINSINIEIYTGTELLTNIFRDIYYIIRINNGMYNINSEQRIYEAGTPISLTKAEIFVYIKKKIINKIDLYNRGDDGRFRSITLFECDNQNCSEIKKFSTNRIQSNFRKSKDYAKWNWSPQRLNEQRVFGENAVKGIYSISPYDRAPEEFDIRTRFGNISFDIDIKYLKKLSKK